jgi:hypothetical protein
MPLDERVIRLATQSLEAVVVAADGARRRPDEGAFDLRR